jgi:hypothetical protein
MISPYDITVDISSLPAAVQNLVTTVDNALTTWTADELIDTSGRRLSVDWANLSGWTQAKETGLKKLIKAYEARGWRTQQVTKDGNQSQFVVVFYRP